MITGGNRGIGASLLETFAKNGATVFASSRKTGALDAICEKWKEQYKTGIIPLYFDISKPDEIKEAFKKLFNTSKKLDILINNAGILSDALLGMVTPDTINETYAVNTFGPIYLMQYASRLMAKNKSGSIINISSIIGVAGNEGQVVYGSSKAALIGATLSAAKELAPNNIRVNAIAPGFIETDMAKSIPEHIFKERLNSIKMQRIGKPQDVANCALFLASDLSAYITGQVIGVDGGMLI